MRWTPALDAGRYTFAINIPPNFQRDVLAGRQPEGAGQRRRHAHEPNLYRQRLYPEYY